MGGGNKTSLGVALLVGGLSPRGRGKRRDTSNRCIKRRSIPAWAGETTGTPRQSPASQVYPRVGGGN